METTPMSYTVEMHPAEFILHPIRRGYIAAGGAPGNWYFHKYATKKYNINLNRYKLLGDTVTVEFNSAQDYILWKLHE